MNMNKKYINGQGLKPYSDIKYGLLKFKKNGCGPIAIYNLFQSLDMDIPIEKIKSQLNKFLPLSIGGLLGTSIFGVIYCLKKEGVGLKCRAFPTCNRIEALIKIHKCGILLYFHGKGSHYIAIEYNKNTDNNFSVYNRSNNYPFKSIYPSIKYLHKNGKIFIPMVFLYPISDFKQTQDSKADIVQK